MTTHIEQDGQQAFKDACNTAWVDCVQRRGTTVEPDLRSAVRNYFEEGFSYGFEAGQDRQSTRPEPPVTEEEIAAAARTLNRNGWTCNEGQDEPGRYDECEDCRHICLRLARAALEAARATREGARNG